MTIIKPSPPRVYRFLILVFGILLLSGVLYIFEYNALAQSRFEVQSLKKDIVELEAVNADLKKELYKTIEPERLQELALTSGLVLEREPQFLSSDKWLSDSSR